MNSHAVLPVRAQTRPAPAAAGMGGVVTRVSVVTVCLNAAATIADTMDSVAAQEGCHIEHLVIDGGSGDGTAHLVAARKPDYFVSEPDGGIYPAMQKGALAATGDVVFFLNSGDTFHDDRVVADVVAFFNRTGCDAVFGNLLPCYRSAGDSHDHRAFKAGKLLDLSYFNNRRLFYDESIHHQTIFYRRDIFDVCGFICADPRANGEYHLNMCAFVGRGLTVKHLPRPICRFALGGTSTADFTAEWGRFEQAREILRGLYFPDGADIPIAGEHEYLHFRPDWRTRAKIRLRKSRWHGVLSRVRDIRDRLLP
ncbi:MAG: glycosyltransferase family 2 protein [Lautropia sp.]